MCFFWFHLFLGASAQKFRWIFSVFCPSSSFHFWIWICWFCCVTTLMLFPNFSRIPIITLLRSSSLHLIYVNLIRGPNHYLSTSVPTADICLYWWIIFVLGKHFLQLHIYCFYSNTSKIIIIKMFVFGLQTLPAWHVVSQCLSLNHCWCLLLGVV